METFIVRGGALGLVVALIFALRRHRRMIQDDAEYPEKPQRAESWLTKGSGRS